MVVILANVENIQKNCKKKIKTKHYINFLLMEASLNGKNPFFPPLWINKEKQSADFSGIKIIFWKCYTNANNSNFNIN